MSTQVSTWPKDLYHADSPVPAASATPYGKATAGSLAAESALENGAAILFMAFFAAELVAVLAGIGFILASLAALAW